MAADRCRRTHGGGPRPGLHVRLVAALFGRVGQERRGLEPGRPARSAPRLPPRADHPLAGRRGLRGSIYALAAAARTATACWPSAAMGRWARWAKSCWSTRSTASWSRSCKDIGKRSARWRFRPMENGSARWTRPAKRGCGSGPIGRRGCIYKQDAETYGAEAAAMIAKQPKLRPLAFLGSHASRRADASPAGRAKPASAGGSWRSTLPTRADFRALDTIHYGLVTALAASPDGTRLASADAERRTLPLGPRPSAEPAGRSSHADRGVLSLAFQPRRPDARRRHAGRQGRRQEPTCRSGTWQARTMTRNASTWPITSMPARSARTETAWPMRAASTGRSLRRVAGRRCQARDLARHGRRIGKVAFAVEEPYYRVAFGNDLARPRVQ